ncbi:hypothetical protein CXB51_026023 [Gossypium anomalum]|uniref:Uncharacterized protein n=1 Tax=Gossypium anomalum TaxID=47600 RepID=A0A8J5YDH2_9ROSI|nr:hypothetical protein CXB51_026023 [Gossypium anomalum]
MFGGCTSDKQFVCILPGWEGSAADSRVLQNAISRPNDLKVPQDELPSQQVKGTKRHLNEAEDSKLISCMMDLYNIGTYNVDYGFRQGYLLVLEKTLEEKYIGCGLKVKPHIDSRLRNLKKEWEVVYDMIYGHNSSGFG